MPLMPITADTRPGAINRSTDQPGSLHRIAGGHPSRARHLA